MLGQSVRLQPVPIQSLSELERARLQEVALYHLEERDLDFKISIPKGERRIPTNTVIGALVFVSRTSVSTLKSLPFFQEDFFAVEVKTTFPPMYDTKVNTILKTLHKILHTSTSRRVLWSCYFF